MVVHMTTNSDKVFKSMVDVGFRLDYIHLIEPYYNTKTGCFVAKMGTPADLLKLQEKERHDKNVN